MTASVAPRPSQQGLQGSSDQDHGDGREQQGDGPAQATALDPAASSSDSKMAATVDSTRKRAASGCWVEQRSNRARGSAVSPGRGTMALAAEAAEATARVALMAPHHVRGRTAQDQGPEQPAGAQQHPSSLIEARDASLLGVHAALDGGADDHQTWEGRWCRWRAPSRHHDGAVPQATDEGSGASRAARARARFADVQPPSGTRARTRTSTQSPSGPGSSSSAGAASAERVDR